MIGFVVIGTVFAFFSAGSVALSGAGLFLILVTYSLVGSLTLLLAASLPTRRAQKGASRKTPEF